MSLEFHSIYLNVLLENSHLITCVIFQNTDPVADE